MELIDAIGTLHVVLTQNPVAIKTYYLSKKRVKVHFRLLKRFRNLYFLPTIYLPLDEAGFVQHSGENTEIVIFHCKIDLIFFQFILLPVRSSSQATLDSLDLTRFSEDGERGVADRVAVLEFELRKAHETINGLRNNLTVATGQIFLSVFLCRYSCSNCDTTYL
ncbi:hypothetical protein BC332_34933 [Capsicum chinense]|nr:hypothetical protein BC332_34933 [Capsicum chinense]